MNYNGKTLICCKITEGKVGHKFGEFSFTRKRRLLRELILDREEKGGKKKV